MEIAIIPRFIVNRLFQDEVYRIHFNVGITSLLFIIILVFWNSSFNYLSSVPHFCLFREVLNIPCPGCGIIRSLFCMGRGEISLSLGYNPAGLFLFFYFMVQIPLRIVAITFRNTGKSICKISRLLSKFLFIILLLAWILK